MNRPRLQHYVPQFLLRRFTDSTGALNVFDKASDRSFTTGTRGIAAENYFYDVEIGKDVLTLEPGLADLEGQAADVIDRIHQDGSLSQLSATDRGIMSVFVAIQALRTQHHRANILHLTRELTKRINRIVPDDQSDARISSPSDEDAKRMSLALLLEGSKEIAQIIAAKPWVLVRAPEGDLYIGDNPVAMHNERDLGPYGSIGFAVPGVEIHLPLSPSLALFIPCHSTVAKAQDALDDAELLRKVNEPAWKRIEPRLSSLKALVGAVKSGDPIDLEPENVERENSLQVGFAGRWVFASTNDFELARRMIADDSDWQTGPFGTVS